MDKLKTKKFKFFAPVILITLFIFFYAITVFIFLF